MKKGILVVAGFAVITIALTVFWTEWGRVAYGQFLKSVAPPLYELIGFEGARVGAFRQRYINWIPFAGLILVTPGITWRRRVGGLAIGLFALFVGHLGLNLTERVHKGAHLPFVPSLVSDAMPFVLWILIAYPVISEWFATALAVPSPSSDSSGEEGASAAPSESANSKDSS